jgi:hypothetical protein
VRLYARFARIVLIVGGLCHGRLRGPQSASNTPVPAETSGPTFTVSDRDLHFAANRSGLR